MSEINRTYADIWDVFKKTCWLVGPKGARCTTELKICQGLELEIA